MWLWHRTAAWLWHRTAAWLWHRTAACLWHRTAAWLWHHTVACLWHRTVAWCVVITPYLVWWVVTSFSEGNFTFPETYSLTMTDCLFPYRVCSYQNSELCAISRNATMCVWTGYISFDFIVSFLTVIYLCVYVRKFRAPWHFVVSSLRGNYLFLSNIFDQVMVITILWSSLNCLVSLH